MKKLLLFVLIITSINAWGQKITNLPESVSAPGTSLLYVRQGATGDLIRKITKANLLSDYAPLNNTTFTGLTLLEQLKISAAGVTITAITSDGANIRFWSGVTELTAVPGVGGATWGTIAGLLSNQVDLNSALALKVPTTRTINGYALGGGDITLAKADIGLGNVDNTSDINKPVSIATQVALDAKQETLVSATNIKTVGGISILGAGDIPAGGTGTVTSVAVTAANGVSASITNPTTAADLSFTLGAITPTSVNGIPFSGLSTPSLEVTGTSAISGTNTGDNAVNTRYSGLVTNATHTGDVTGSGALTIASGAVTLAKMANMATASVIYRKTAGSGAPEVNTLATLKTDLGLTGTNSGDQTDISGNAATATKLLTSRTINGTGFDGSANITVVSNIAPGASGNVMKSNGTVWTSAALTGTGTWGAIDGDIEDQTDLMAKLNDTIQGSTLYPELADTIPLFTFGYGQGKAIDTTGIDMTSDFGAFYNDGSDTIVIARIIAFVKASKNAPSIFINIYFGTRGDLNGTIDSVLVDPLEVVSQTTGNSGLVFHNQKIPPGRWVVAKTAKSLGTTGTIPAKLRGSVSGYKILAY